MECAKEIEHLIEEHLLGACRCTRLEEALCGTRKNTCLKAAAIDAASAQLERFNHDERRRSRLPELQRKALDEFDEKSRVVINLPKPAAVKRIYREQDKSILEARRVKVAAAGHREIEIHNRVYDDFVSLRHLPVKVPVPVSCERVGEDMVVLVEKVEGKKLVFKPDDSRFCLALNLGRSIGRLFFHLGLDCMNVQFHVTDDGEELVCSGFQNCSPVDFDDPGQTHKLASLVFDACERFPNPESVAWTGFSLGARWEAGLENNRLVKAFLKRLVAKWSRCSLEPGSEDKQNAGCGSSSSWIQLFPGL